VTFVVDRASIWTWQSIQIFHHLRKRRYANLPVRSTECNAAERTPIGAGSETMQEFDQSHLPIKPDHGIQSRGAFEYLGRFETSVVTAHREVSGHAEAGS
jgi:hypothetical protein